MTPWDCSARLSCPSPTGEHAEVAQVFEEVGAAAGIGHAGFTAPAWVLPVSVVVVVVGVGTLA
jgi:hypothetical protein